MKDYIITENKKAWHDYQILEKIEVGIVLSGTEVKSLREKMCSLSGAYVAVLKGELWLIGCNITPYKFGSAFNHAAVHDRKLLCHKKEIRELKMKTEAKGLTIVPLKLYVKNGRIKLEIGVARGKNAVDKRNTLKEKDLKREMCC